MRERLEQGIFDETGQQVIITSYVAVIEYIDANGDTQTYLAAPTDQVGWRTMGLIEFAAFVVRRTFARALD